MTTGYFLIWSVAVLAAAIFLIIRAVIDFRAGKFVWGILGIASAAVFLLTPIQTHAIKIDLPADR